MNTIHTTPRRSRVFHGYKYPLLETLPLYGWRCGYYSLRPELARYSENPEFRAGVRDGRAQRRATPIADAARLILGLPKLVSMRRSVQRAYGDAAYRAKLAQREHAWRDGVGAWDEWNRLSNEYQTERARLLRLRGVSA